MSKQTSSNQARRPTEQEARDAIETLLRMLARAVIRKLKEPANSCNDRDRSKRN
jgi:hypothetical protein